MKDWAGWIAAITCAYGKLTSRLHPCKSVEELCTDHIWLANDHICLRRMFCLQGLWTVNEE